MRIISGSARGCTLFSPDGVQTRPTTDRTREALFNILAPEIYGSVFLDLFAGSGAIGLEALSRGARKTIFVDNNIKSVQAIQANIEKTKFTDKAKLIQSDAMAALNLPYITNLKFDFIFLDPPYGSDIALKAVKIINERNLLNETGRLIIEYGEKNLLPQTESLELGFTLIKQKKYSKTFLNFYQCEQKVN